MGFATGFRVGDSNFRVKEGRSENNYSKAQDLARQAAVDESVHFENDGAIKPASQHFKIVFETTSLRQEYYTVQLACEPLFLIDFTHFLLDLYRAKCR